MILCKLIGHKFWRSPDWNPWGKEYTAHCQRCGKRQG